MKISTPGRICLFGEHQDYLGLPIIAMAISLYASINGEKRDDSQIIIHKPNLGETESFSLHSFDYISPRDYFKSGLKVCIDEGLHFSHGFDCALNSQIPIKAGTSSSSAIIVSWIHFLSKMADNPPHWDNVKIAELAYRAEVLEFSEPGGMMDQYSTSMGNFIYLTTTPIINVEILNSKLGAFVLGDSQEQKDTLSVLHRCKNQRLSLIEKCKKINPKFDLKTSNEVYINLSDDEQNLLEGTYRNRDILKDGLTELLKSKINHKKIGSLLNEHHQILRDVLKISTPKIEKMISTSMKAGALGAKINGSGGGGCMFAYAPHNPEKVAHAIEAQGGTAYIIKLSEGTQCIED